MRSIFKFFFLAAGVAVLLTACDKKDTLNTFTNGSAPVLTASAATIAPLPADSNGIALTLSWTNPKYASDSATYKYTIEMDSAGKGFTKPSTKVVSGSMKTTYTAKELNTILLNNGYAFGVPVDMDVRVTSSYANNNERLVSNTVRIKMTPYKVPPRVALPAQSRLFIVGDATIFGWTNDPSPAFPAAREFSRLDETTWAGIFYMNGSGGYKLLQTQGNWDTQFHMTNGGTATAGSFVQENADPSFSSPATAGWYKLTFDFQNGKYTVAPYAGTLPTNLFIVGNATPGGDVTGWNNPVPVPTQQFTRLNSSEWKLTLPMIGGKEYLLLPVNGDWSHKYAVPNNGVAGLKQGGEFGYDAAQNFPGPSASGTYTININFAAATTTAGSSGKFTVQ